ncbi:Caleosin [Rhynchospora pubera]|uniref:Caleosin n=1 Tax=Rhynchospora pubera TaxID=906938 RepID=A0AAV8DBI6_9POAL|nr:Caleosin [Rhynchospora pubera]
MRLQKLSTLLFLCVFTALALGRANGKASSSQNGTGDSKATDMTPLQMHASFFDRNKDGMVTLKETYQGMRAIGCSVPVSAAGSLFINGFLSPKTRPPGKSASASLPIYIENINKGKHGSDTDSYDSQGRFVPEKFEQIFMKYAKTNPNALTSKELDDMLKGNKDPGDTKGPIAAQGEWRLLYDLAKDKDGFLQKDTIRGVYDGSLFYKLEQARSSSKIKKS